MKLIQPLTVPFCLQPTLQVARDLLGKLLLHDDGGERLVGRIVETEGYRRDDPACHAYRGRTPRNAPMFGPPGRWYVYRIHRQWLLNLVTAPEGEPEAVLIRAVEPLDGLAAMRHRRGKERAPDLCSGPGKLCRAFGIDGAYTHADALNGPLRIVDDGLRVEQIIATTRIGVSQGAELPYRFLIKESPFVSRPPRTADLLKAFTHG